MGGSVSPEISGILCPNFALLSKGDQIRINKNSVDKDKNRLNNGTVLTVDGFTKQGDIKAVNKLAKKHKNIILDKSHANFDYAYCTTSYSAQGKTIDHVYISQPTSSFVATNQKQFYVSISRGREGVMIYTDDKESLLGYIGQSGDRQSATELLKFHKRLKIRMQKRGKIP